MTRKEHDRPDTSREHQRPRPAGSAEPGTGSDFDPTGLTEEDLQGPPARETIVIRDDRERQAAEELDEHTATSPELSAGDVDADWQRADTVGEEAPEGTVATPDQNVVDDILKAVGVPRAPDEEFRTSTEILEARDRHRWDQEDNEPSDA